MIEVARRLKRRRASARPSAAVAAALLLGLLVTGCAQVRVPDVQGMRLDEAMTTLTNAGFTSETDVPGGVVSMHSWTVRGQDPDAGTSAAEGSKIRLHVVKAAG